MASVRVLVLRTAGTNCDLETVQAFQLAGAEAERLHIKALIDSRRRLSEFQILAFPGGFSYGDDLGAGTVLANQIGTRLRDDLDRFVADRGYIMGICNGFQVLVRLGLLPVPGGPQSVSLVENESGLFEDRWVKLRVETASSPVLEKGDELEMPVAHKEGRLVFRDPAVLEEMKVWDQIAFRYISVREGADADGSDPGYPDNPNGSTEAIAGIQSPCGRILGLMPHPERHLRTLHHPDWTRRASVGLAPGGDDWRQGDGFRIFERIVNRAADGMTNDE